MERTKTAIIEAFREALEEMPINKITVKNIVERCGINRNTFYYYFPGIPELVEYHLTSMADQLMESVDQPDVRGEMHRMIRYLAQRKKSVLHVYRYLPREQFMVFLNKIAIYAVEKHMRRIMRDQEISEEDLLILVRYYKCTLVGMSLDWLDAGMNYDAEAVLGKLEKLMNESAQRPTEEMLVLPEK